MPPYSTPPPEPDPLQPRTPLPESFPPSAPSIEEVFVPDVRKVFAVGFFLGMAIAILLLYLYPSYERFREVERAKTAVQVKQILGAGK